MPFKRWIVMGYHGTDPFFDATLPENVWTEPRVGELLRRLLSKYLSESDIVNASRAPRDPYYSPVLKVHSSGSSAGGPRRTLTVGEDPHFVAGLFEADEESP
jgi:hypothetical protein